MPAHEAYEAVWGMSPSVRRGVLRVAESVVVWWCNAFVNR